MGKKGVYGKGPVAKATHNKLAEEAEAKAAKENNRERRESLENLAKQHRNIAETGNPEPPEGKK